MEKIWHQFIVNTPLHLLIAQSIILNDGLNNCQLLCFANDKIKYNLAFDKTLWQEVSELPGLVSASLISRREFIKSCQRVVKQKCKVLLYLGNDFQLENQLLRYYSKPDFVCLFDDGLASYLLKSKHPSFMRLVARIFYYRLLWQHRVNNFKGMGCSLYDSRLVLDFGSAFDPMGKYRSVRLKLSDRLTGCFADLCSKEVDMKKRSVVWLTQPISEFNVMSARLEDDCIVRATSELGRFGVEQVIVKSHPKEDESRMMKRMEKIESNFAGSVVKPCVLKEAPIELAVLAFRNLFAYVSIYSSALFTIKMIDPRAIVLSAASVEQVRRLDPFGDMLGLFDKFDIKCLNEW